MMQQHTTNFDREVDKLNRSPRVRLLRTPGLRWIGYGWNQLLIWRWNANKDRGR